MTDEETQMAGFFNDCANRGVMATFDNEEDAVAVRQVESWNIAPGERVLEAGCGSGRLTQYLAGKIGSHGEVLAMDLAPGMIAKADQRQLPETIHFVVGSVKTVDRPDAWFDKIICFNVFPHFDERERIFKEFHRILKPQGHLWITHTKTRAAINDLHRHLGQEVNRHNLPDNDAMLALLLATGFDCQHAVDTVGDGYSIMAIKNND